MDLGVYLSGEVVTTISDKVRNFKFNFKKTGLLFMNRVSMEEEKISILYI